MLVSQGDPYLITVCVKQLCVCYFCVSCVSSKSFWKVVLKCVRACFCVFFVRDRFVYSLSELITHVVCVKKSCVSDYEV